MFINAGRIKLHIGISFALIFAVLANTGAGTTFVLTFAASLLHELTHLFLLFKCGCTEAMLDFYPGGIKLIADGFSRLSYRNTVLCTVSAPVMNILTGALSAVFGKITQSPFLTEFAGISLALGIVNLLPLRFLDGGRALNAFLLQKKDIVTAGKICDFFAIISLIIIGGLFFYALINKENYIFILFFFIYCTLGCFCDKTGGALT